MQLWLAQDSIAYITGAEEPRHGGVVTGDARRHGPVVTLAPDQLWENGCKYLCQVWGGSV